MSKENKYSGMTVNERLYASGLIDDFDKFVAEKNVKKVRLILKSVELNEVNIITILEHYGLSKINN